MHDIHKALLVSKRLIATSHQNIKVTIKVLRQSQKIIQRSRTAILNGK
jgi:hypothetical protein